MAGKMRMTPRNLAVWILMGAVMFGLAGFGVTGFSSTHRDIGRVGDTSVDINQYARRIEMERQQITAQTGARPSLQDLQELGIDRAIQSRLFADAAMVEAARRLGISVGDDEVGRQVLAAQAFQGVSGQFDRELYRLALRQQGSSEQEFEARLRAETAASILGGAVTGGARAPASTVALYTGYITQTRSFRHAELTPDVLTDPLAAPTEEELAAYHATHTEEFSLPEIRRITYAWLSPAMLAEAADPDEAALRAAYEARIDEFVTPERRMVERLVYPSEAEAEAALARVEAGEASFETLVEERGLRLVDADLGIVTEAALGANGAAIFALEEPGVTGPLPTPLGPALFSMNAILDSQEIGFEEVREMLAAETALEAAARQVSAEVPQLEDLLAGGATIEDLAAETPMALGEIALSEGVEDGIAAYPAFREAAAAATTTDFPVLLPLEDGGIFAFRLDAVEPPALIPFEEVRDAVAEGWTETQQHGRLLAHAATLIAGIDNGAEVDDLDLPMTAVERLPRGGWLEDAPLALAEAAFALAPGEADMVDTEGRVFIVALDQIHSADAGDPTAAALSGSISDGLAQSLAADFEEYYIRAVQTEAGITLNQDAITALHAQMP